MQLLRKIQIKGKVPDFFKSRALAPMVQWFEKRTNIHIQLVNKFAELIQLSLWGEIRYQYPWHDFNKFEDPLVIPYVHLSWKYHKPSYQYPKGVKEQITKASLLHVLSNPHHPEFWDKKNAEINESNRDKPSGSKVFAYTMDEKSLCELVADWSAVGFEKNRKGPRDWADKNIGVRWEFSKQQKDLIYQAIEQVEKFLK